MSRKKIKKVVPEFSWGGTTPLWQKESIQLAEYIEDEKKFTDIKSKEKK